MPFTVAGVLDDTLYEVEVTGDPAQPAVGSRRVAALIAHETGETVMATPVGPAYVVSPGNATSILALLTTATKVTRVSGDAPSLVPLGVERRDGLCRARDRTSHAPKKASISRKTLTHLTDEELHAITVCANLYDTDTLLAVRAELAHRESRGSKERPPDCGTHRAQSQGCGAEVAEGIIPEEWAAWVSRVPQGTREPSPDKASPTGRLPRTPETPVAEAAPAPEAESPVSASERPSDTPEATILKTPSAQV